MCLIIHKPAGQVIQRELLENALLYSKDGMGVCAKMPGVVENNVWKTFKSTNTKSVLRFANAKWTDVELYVHLRKCTAGAKGRANLHPYKIPGTEIVLMHNGTMDIWATGEDSDTRIFAGMVAPSLQANPELAFNLATQKLWEGVIGKGMVVLLYPDGRTVRMGTRPWLEYEGLRLSNGYAWGSWYE